MATRSLGSMIISGNKSLQNPLISGMRDPKSLAAISVSPIVANLQLFENFPFLNFRAILKQNIAVLSPSYAGRKAQNPKSDLPSHILTLVDVISEKFTPGVATVTSNTYAATYDGNLSKSINICSRSSLESPPTLLVPSLSSPECTIDPFGFLRLAK